MHTTFEKPGYINTQSTLEVLVEGIKEYGIRQIVIASTYGDTGLEAARMLQNMDVSLVVITHNFGFRKQGDREMSREVQHQIESMGAIVHTGTMPFRSIGTAIKEKQEYSQQDLVANTLRVFGQGIKVCVEIAMMAADAGLIRPDDILTMAGTGRGADTVALIEPRSTNKMFDLKVKHILTKPITW